MSKLTQFLQKAGLVESDESSFELPVDPTPVPDPPAPAPEPASRPAVRSSVSGPARFTIDGDVDAGAAMAPDPATSADTTPDQAASDYVLAEGVSIDSIFQDANVPQTSFPIERLQKLIDGLKQLDPVTQKAAVLAMDAADDNWAIDDVLKDAQLKTDALHAYADRVTAKAAQIQASVERDVAGMTSQKNSAIADIQAQIADLQKKLEATATQHATGISDLSARKATAQQAAERERQRVNDVINKINNLIHPFLSNVSNR